MTASPVHIVVSNLLYVCQLAGLDCEELDDILSTFIEYRIALFLTERQMRYSYQLCPNECEMVTCMIQMISKWVASGEVRWHHIVSQIVGLFKVCDELVEAIEMKSRWTRFYLET